MPNNELDDVILLSKAEVDKLGFSVLYLSRELKKAYEGEWGSHQYTKEEYLRSAELRDNVKRINKDNLAVRVGSVRVDVGGNIVGKLVAIGPMAENTIKAMKSKKGVRVVPRIGWEYGQGGMFFASILKPFIITFDVSYR